MANEWIVTDSRACYDTSTPGFTLSQIGLMTPGQYYFFKITIEGMTQGKLNIQGFETVPEITEDGEYEYFIKAVYEDLVINPGSLSGSTFNGCIDNIELSVVPLYTIKDRNDNVVFTQTDTTGVTGDRNWIQYIVDWTDIDAGEYYIEFADGILTYQSDCFRVALIHACTMVIEWYNLQDGFRFDYSGLTFRPQVRVTGKTRNDRYVTEDKEVYDYSDGTKEITYARVYEEVDMVVGEVPHYIRQAIGVGMNHDVTYVNDVKAIFEDNEIGPAHRNSSQLAPMIIPVKLIVNDLLNSNC